MRFVEWNWRTVGKMVNGVENGILEEVLGPIGDHFLYGPRKWYKILIHIGLLIKILRLLLSLI